MSGFLLLSYRSGLIFLAGGPARTERLLPMLFPLSKSFTSTSLFQSGGQHPAPVAHRVWEGRTPGQEERVVEVHRLLTERKPFSEHMKMIQQRSEALQMRDVFFGRTHKEGIRELQETLDRDAAVVRQQRQEGIRDFKRRRAVSEGALAQTMRDQHEAYSTTKTEMEARVKELPMLGSGPIPRESSERLNKRLNGAADMSAGARQYYEERREFAQKLGERKESLARATPCRPKDHIIEEKKTAGLAALSKTGSDYEAHLVGLYDKHHVRVKHESRKHREDFQAHLDHRLNASEAMASRQEALKQKVTEEKTMREERLVARPRGFAGYSPKAKSDQRLRKEEALAELAALGGK